MPSSLHYQNEGICAGKSFSCEKYLTDQIKFTRPCVQTLKLGSAALSIFLFRRAFASRFPK